MKSNDPAELYTLFIMTIPCIWKILDTDLFIKILASLTVQKFIINISIENRVGDNVIIEMPYN